MTRHKYLISQRADGRWEGRRQGFRRVSILNADRKVVEERIRELANKKNFEIVVDEGPAQGSGRPTSSTGNVPRTEMQEA